MKSIFILIWSLNLVFNSNMESKIKKVSFDEFEPWLHRTDETIYVINFWATWCKPCIEELPAFEEINKTYRNKNIKVLLVSLDFPGQMDSSLIPFIEKHQISSDVILLDDPNSNDWINKVNPDWTGAIPATIIYYKDERIFNEGGLTFDYLNDKIQYFLNKQNHE
ncbi:TlpA disulfide reductase family protein [Bacteroidota bacterium]